MLECTLRASTVNMAGAPDSLVKACPGFPEIVLSRSSCTALRNEDKKHRGATDGNECCEGVCSCVCLCESGMNAWRLSSFPSLERFSRFWKPAALTAHGSPVLVLNHMLALTGTRTYTHTCHFCRVSGITTQEECRAILKRWTAQALWPREENEAFVEEVAHCATR